jgi:hypothetical protein
MRDARVTTWEWEWVVRVNILRLYELTRDEQNKWDDYIYFRAVFWDLEQRHGTAFVN